ncbi:MAG: FAD-binding protein, partial [Desulfobacula sp.]|nr:FAD-binding protein [Desulfobacula sp.]
TGQEPRVGVFVCSCGTNIAGVIDIKDVSQYTSTLGGVDYVENNLFTCFTDTQDLIAQKIKGKNFNRIVIAACTPRTHEVLFQETLQNIGLNKYMIEMANIRNQNSWVHPDEPEKVTAKTKDQIRMAVARVIKNYPLNDIQVNVTPRALVIGGGLAGMSSALNLAAQGYETVLLEKENRHKDDTETIEFGAYILATGGKAYVPDEYMYNKDNRILTSLEFDRLMIQHKSGAVNVDSTIFIQCVGSRDDQRPYCSRVCCTSAITNAVG